MCTASTVFTSTRAFHRYISQRGTFHSTVLADCIFLHSSQAHHHIVREPKSPKNSGLGHRLVLCHGELGAAVQIKSRSLGLSSIESPVSERTYYRTVPHDITVLQYATSRYGPFATGAEGSAAAQQHSYRVLPGLLEVEVLCCTYSASHPRSRTQISTLQKSHREVQSTLLHPR